PTLTGPQPCQLLSVAKAGLNLPAAPLPIEQALPAPMQIVAHDVVQTSLAVCCHDESDSAIFREIHRACPGAGIARNTVAGKLRSQLRDRLGATAIGNSSIGLQCADPNELLGIQPLREPAGIVPAVKGQVLERQPGPQ